MAYLKQGGRYEIAGRQVILLADEVGISPRSSSPVVQIEESNELHEFIWLIEEELQVAREKYPATPIYGIWQTVIANGMIDVARPLHVIRFTELSGMYLVVEDGRIKESGRFVNDQIIDSASLEISTAVEIDLFSVVQLKLPHAPAVLPQERAADRARKARAGMIFGAAAAVAIVLLGAGTDYLLQSAAEARKAKAMSLNNQAEDVKASAAEVLRNADPFTVEQRARYQALTTRAAEVLEKTQSFHLDTSYGAPQWVVDVTRVPVDISFPVITQGRPGKPPSVVFSADGSAPPSMPPTQS